ncbi:MAG: four helix bundle protein [Rhodothermales bacterium]
MQDFKKLLVWEKAHLVVLKVYKLTKSFPIDERYGLSSQMRRCAVSIPSNMAEGCGRDTNAQLRHFLEISMGSAAELEYQLLLAYDLKYIPTDSYEKVYSDITEIRKMLRSLIQKVSAS